MEEALARLTVDPPAIRTSPGDGNPGLVALPTWLMFEPGSVGPLGPVIGASDGILSVEIEAHPAPSGDVVWNTGDGRTERCERELADPADCSHVYERSSLGQPGRVGGQPAYEITASLQYEGSYRVLLGGVQVGQVVTLPEITVASEPYLLAVEEAQALNTSG